MNLRFLYCLLLTRVCDPVHFVKILVPSSNVSVIRFLYPLMNKLLFVAFPVAWGRFYARPPSLFVKR